MKLAFCILVIFGCANVRFSADGLKAIVEVHNNLRPAIANGTIVSNVVSVIYEEGEACPKCSDGFTCETSSGLLETPRRELKAFVLSAWFFPQSESLGNNSLALVMSINLGRQKSKQYALENSKLVIIAKNKTTGVVMRTNYERITLHENCQMVTIFATVQLLPNPDTISMLTNDTLMDIPFKTPAHEKKDFVICISPLYVSEQWHNFLLASHVYKHFGGHLHVYFISAVSAFYQLMHEYEKSGYITMQTWDRVFFPLVPADIADAYQQMEFQSLAGAQTDCILQYKESAKFVALFDINDVLIPKLAPSYVEEFQSVIGDLENVSFLTYKKQNFDAKVYNISRFSIEAMLNSFVDKNTNNMFNGVVVIPKNLNYTWMNRPLKISDGFQSLDVTKNTVVYIENITWVNEVPVVDTDLAACRIFSNRSMYPQRFYEDAFSEIEDDLETMLEKPSITEIFPTLPNFYYFYYLVNDCFEQKYYTFLRSDSTNYVKNTCPGPQMCGFYQNPNVQCVHVNAIHNVMAPVEPITYYYATGHYYTSDIGCYAH